MLFCPTVFGIYSYSYFSLVIPHINASVEKFYACGDLVPKRLTRHDLNRYK